MVVGCFDFFYVFLLFLTDFIQPVSGSSSSVFNQLVIDRVWDGLLGRQEEPLQCFHSLRDLPQVVELNLGSENKVTAISILNRAYMGTGKLSNHTWKEETRGFFLRLKVWANF